ncbi:hypothetical protein F5887DRAFT_599169 [Amanita rubescens]|nr:hypothetical protein F5887DRAFT_599169 [Amanita rubescens]
MQLFSYLLLFFALGVSVAAAPLRDNFKANSPLEHLDGAEGERSRRPSLSGLPPYEPPPPPLDSPPLPPARPGTPVHVPPLHSPPLPPARPNTPVHVHHDDQSSHLTRRGYPLFGELSHRTKVNLDHWSRMYLLEGWPGTIAVWDANIAIPQICTRLTCMREI